MKGIGLVFAGGGGKGAYEIGVWKYLHEIGLDQYVRCVSGTSVGALNAALFVGSSYELAEKLWLDINQDSNIIRKGAVSAKKDEKLLIPINMRDGSLLCIGKGNEDWNCSAPHGAGRLFSRSAAKYEFTVEEYAKTMEDAGIYSTCIDWSTLDECPMAYKGMEDIVNNIEPTAKIVKVLKPVYNFKATSPVKKEEDIGEE